MEAEAQAPADERSLKEAAHIIPLPELVARISCNQRVKPGISVKPSGRFENEARHLNTAWWPKNFTQNNHRSRDGHLRPASVCASSWAIHAPGSLASTGLQ